MEFGVLTDRVDHERSRTGPERVLEWIRGEPKRKWFGFGFKSGPGDRMQVATLRCTQCGFLELYARPPA